MFDNIASQDVTQDFFLRNRLDRREVREPHSIFYRSLDGFPLIASHDRHCFHGSPDVQDTAMLGRSDQMTQNRGGLQHPPIAFDICGNLLGMLAALLETFVLGMPVLAGYVWVV